MGRLLVAVTAWSTGAAAFAYNSDPVCYDRARAVLPKVVSGCPIHDPLGSHAIAAWFAVQYLHHTFPDARTPEGKAAAWALEHGGAEPMGSLLTGSNAPDLLNT